jgi:hypothetical protein
MMLKPYVNMLREPLGFWASNCNAENVPDIVHCNGLMPVEEYDKLTFFIAEAFSGTFIANLPINPEITFTGCSVLTFESYQYKGRFESIRACTPADIAMQQQYLETFTETCAAIGFSKEGLLKAYYHQPSFAITFRVTDIFEQTPYNGTGNSVLKK